MVLVRARIKLVGKRAVYSANAVLVDTGVRMSVVDTSIAERIGVEYTGRRLRFLAISGHTIEASEAIVQELEIDGEALKYEAIAVAEIPPVVKDMLKRNGLDENVVIGVLTLERANMVPNTTTERLERVESFIL